MLEAYQKLKTKPKTSAEFNKLLQVIWGNLPQGPINKAKKALGQRRPPPSILIRHNIVVPFKAMLTKISK